MITTADYTRGKSHRKHKMGTIKENTFYNDGVIPRLEIQAFSLLEATGRIAEILSGINDKLDRVDRKDKSNMNFYKNIKRPDPPRAEVFADLEDLAHNLTFIEVALREISVRLDQGS